MKIDINVLSSKEFYDNWLNLTKKELKANPHFQSYNLTSLVRSQIDFVKETLRVHERLPIDSYLQEKLIKIYFETVLEKELNNE